MWRLLSRPTTLGTASALATWYTCIRPESHSLAAPLFHLDGKVALVTGGSRGIGYAIASGLVEHGATVVISGTNQSTLDSARDAMLCETGASPAQISCIAFDVTDEASCTAAVQEIAARTGRTPDILVNNAGINFRARQHGLERPVVAHAPAHRH